MQTQMFFPVAALALALNPLQLLNCSSPSGTMSQVPGDPIKGCLCRIPIEC